MAYAPRTGPNLLRRHYPDGAEGLRAFELAKQQKKAITDARYYQRTKAEKTYGIVAPARTSNTAQAVLAVVGALNNLTDQHEASRRDAEATRRDAEATRRDNEVARRYAEAARKEAVRRGTGVLKQALSTVIAYSNVGEDQQLASDLDYSITTQSQIDMNATSELDEFRDEGLHEADQDAADPGALITGDNAPTLSPASHFFPDEGDNAPAGTHHCLQPSHALPCAHPIAPQHDLHLTRCARGVVAAQRLPSPRCNRASAGCRQRPRPRQSTSCNLYMYRHLQPT